MIVKFKRFTGNHDKDSERVNYLTTPIKARYFRFHPTEWNRHIAMRVGLLGCPYQGSCKGEFMQINEYTPCVENLAYSKESFIKKKTMKKRHIRYQWTKVGVKNRPQIAIDDSDLYYNTQHDSPSSSLKNSKEVSHKKAENWQSQILLSCVNLDNVFVERPVYLIDLKRKAKISGVVIKTTPSSATNEEEQNRYADYMHNLEKLVIYLDDHDHKEQISTHPQVICGSVSSVGGSIFRSRIHITCAKPTKARYVLIEAWGIEKSYSKMFNALLCDVQVYE